MNQYQQEKQEEYDVEGPQFTFDKVNVRLSFIRKVYAILSVQLLITTAFVGLSIKNSEYNTFISNNPAIAILAIIVNITTAYALICYKSLARRVPLNYILLSLFTITEAILVSMITTQYEPKIVFIAACLTAGIVVSLTLYAITTKTDFTMMGGLLFMLSMTLILASILGYFFDTLWLQVAISAFGVILFGLYLIYDTQLIVGGRNRELSIDDYIIGALMLYIDIVRIFIEVLRLLAIANNNR